MYVSGQLIPKADSQSGDWWRRLVEQADRESEAFGRSRVAAERGDAGAQIDLGLFYLTGVGTPKDRTQAGVWLGKAAEQGIARAQCLFDTLKASDADWRAGDETNLAVEMCQKAADEGHADAQYVLSFLYRTGRGVPKDAAQAAAWMQKAAEGGRADAQWMLAYMYQKGEGVPHDEAQSHAWFQKAAEREYPAAMQSLSLEGMNASLRASVSGHPYPEKDKQEWKRLSDAAIEHGYDEQRELLPNLLDSALHRSNDRKR